MNDIDTLAKALNAFQAELVTVGKEADNPFFKSKYADLGSIMKAAQPVLTKHGLSVVQIPSNINGEPALTTVVMHTSGESIEAQAPLILAKNDPQGVGSAITYMRRYAYAAILQIVIDEDDDGNKASPKQAANKPHVASSNNPASNKQRKYLATLLTNRGISTKAMPEYLESNFGVIQGSTMTAKQASEIIEQLVADEENVGALDRSYGNGQS
jgi:hypothetical protein